MSGAIAQGKPRMVELTLPYPPTVNLYWRAIGRGNVKISAEGRRYRKEVSQLCWLNKWVQRLDKALDMTIVVQRPDRRPRDLDNLLKSLWDSMEKAGVYLNDSQIVSCFLTWNADSFRIPYDRSKAVRVLITENEDFWK